MLLTKQQINTILKSDTIVFRHREKNKGIIECVQRESDNTLFEQRVNIEVESYLPMGSTAIKADHVEFFYKGDYPRHNNLLFFLKTLTKKNDVRLRWSKNGHQTTTHKENDLISETLSLQNNDLFCEIHTTVKTNDSANMIK